MISHEYKCIFIHIQRTGGSSIEAMIAGEDWYILEPATKHIIASHAKRIYSKYWDDYFKFSFVRHPVDRVISCLKYADHFGLAFDDLGNINFDGYRNLFGPKKILEFDHRHSQRKEVRRRNHQEGSVYGNILDEKLDFIGKFENIHADVAYVKKRLGIVDKLFPHLEISSLRNYHITDQTAAEIRSLYKHDFQRFDYK